MTRSASRSRSRGRAPLGGLPGGDKPKDVGEAARAGNSEQEIVSVAIKQLPTDIRERLEKLFEEGLLKEGDLDLRSITVFASLNEGLQARVMNHMEGERIYVANARSKSGFLIATCDKAKTGCLDARGLGAIDPWRTALVAMATPAQKLMDLKTERDWLDQKGELAMKVNVDVSVVEKDVGMPTLTVELPLTETCAAVKAKLVALGIKSIPGNRMKLHADTVGFLKERFSLAFYNLADGVTLTLSERKRAGTKFRADHTVMPRRPKTQTSMAAKPAAASPAPSQSAPALGGCGGLPDLPGLPKLGGLPMSGPASLGGTSPAGMMGFPGLPNFPGLPMPGMPGAGGAPGARPPMTMPGMPGLPPLPGMTMPGAKASMGMPGIPGMPGMPGSMPGMPGSMPGMPGGMPGMSGMPGTPGGMPGMSGMPGMQGMPGMPGGMPGMPQMGMMGKAGMPGGDALSKGGMPGMPGGMGGGMPGMGGGMPGMGGGYPKGGMPGMPQMGGMPQGMMMGGATPKGGFGGMP